MKKNKLHIATYQRDVYDGVSVAQHLHNDLPLFDKDVVIRLGGSMPYPNYPVQINSQQSVLNSINKLKQKRLLIAAELETLPLLDKPVYPCVIKGVQRSGGTNVFVINNDAEFNAAAEKINRDYILEPLFHATSEYRLHCTQKEMFFAVKKHKRNPDDVIINRDNHFNKMEFLKPRLWKNIQQQCVAAMKALGLDIACFDVMYDSSNARAHRFAISEANTNPELLNNTYKEYLRQFINLINEKIAALPPAEAYVENIAEAQPAMLAAKEEPVMLTRDQKLLAMEALFANNYTINEDGISIKL